jgi:histidinol-phosphate/aromatic aminotransferase/cobyric acid decarboxylase-like protein
MKEVQKASAGATLRLDGLRHPYGPCPAALEVIGTGRTVASMASPNWLRRRLADVFRVPANAVWFGGAIDDTLVALCQNAAGPIVTLPPSASATMLARETAHNSHIRIARGLGTTSLLNVELAADIPADAVAIVESPSDPLGSLLSPTEAIRLARACRLLVIDERYAEFAGRSLLSLATEFDNVVILRSFAEWSGPDEAPSSWVVTRSDLPQAPWSQAEHVDADACGAALAALSSLRSVEATLRLVREERSRLFRMLRKLSYLDPIPSWGPFVSARVAIGSREAVVAGLLERGIRVHAPCEQGLEAYLRFGIGSYSEMDRLKAALIDLAPEILA